MHPQTQNTLKQSHTSPWRVYAQLVVGYPSLPTLLKHECLTGLFGDWPGALGYWLRRRTYRHLFDRAGTAAIIGRHVSIRGAKRIQLGHGVAIDDNVVLDARGEKGRIEIGDGVLISRNTIIRARNGTIRIGTGSDIGAHCLLATDQRLEIGANVLVAAYTYLCAGGNHAFDRTDIPIIQQGFIPKGGIIIEDDVWIGSHGMVMDGVTIGRGSVLGSHALANRDIPAYAIAWGQPAERRRSRIASEPAATGEIS